MGCKFWSGVTGYYHKATVLRTEIALTSEPYLLNTPTLLNTITSFLLDPGTGSTAL